MALQVDMQADASSTAHKAAAATKQAPKKAHKKAFNKVSKKARQAATARQQVEEGQHVGPLQAKQQPRQAQQAQQAGGAAATMATALGGTTAASQDNAPAPGGMATGTTCLLQQSQLVYFVDTCLVTCTWG